MKEESQIEEMRAALQGERERAEERRRSTENVRELLEPTEARRGAEVADEPPRRRGLLDRLLGR